MQGDESELFARYDERLRRAVRGDVNTSPDNVDDACAFAWSQLVATQPRRETVFAWLKAVARREAIRLDGLERRKESLDRHAELRAAPDQRSIAVEPAATRHSSEVTQGMLEVKEQLAELPLRLREVALLKGSGWRYEEIADRLNVSRARVGQLLASANSRMREAHIRDIPPSSERAALLRCLEQDPPGHVVTAIGWPPRVSPKLGGEQLRREWRRLALAIMDYRAKYGVGDPQLALGRATADDTKQALQQRIDDFRRERRLTRGISRG